LRLKRGTGVLWPDNAVAYKGTAVYEAASHDWWSAAVFTLRDGNDWYYPIESGPTAATCTPTTDRAALTTSWTGNENCFGIGWNNFVYPVVLDKLTFSQWLDFLSHR
jgi:hypothetical protein